MGTRVVRWGEASLTNWRAGAIADLADRSGTHFFGGHRRHLCRSFGFVASSLPSAASTRDIAHALSVLWRSSLVG
tara:strand:+ start:10443 stop:10667 length:225 start_codon:yes stop_codon:yes gene_type:complete